MSVQPDPSLAIVNHSQATSTPESSPETPVVVHRTLDQLIKDFSDVSSLRGKTLTGTEANLILQHHGVVVYKFTNLENNHRGVQYSEGVIRDHREFDADARCSSGIYCAYGKSFAKWFNYNTGDLNFNNVWVYVVSFLPESVVTFESSEKLKSNVIVLSDRRPIKEMETFWNTPQQVDTILSIERTNILQSPWNLDLLYKQLQSVHFFTRADQLQGAPEEIIIQVLGRLPMLIKDIPSPTLEMKRRAISANGLALQFIPDADESLEILAVENNPDAIEFVKSPRPALLYHVARSYSSGLLICLVKAGKHLLINQDLLDVCFSSNQIQIETLFSEMHKQNSMHLVPNEVIIHIINKDPRAAGYFAISAAKNSISQELFEQIIKLESVSPQLCDTLHKFFAHDNLTMSAELLSILVKSRPELIYTLQTRQMATSELWEVALSASGDLIRHLKPDERTESLSWIALKQNIFAAFPYIKITSDMRKYVLVTDPTMAINFDDASEDEILKAIAANPKTAKCLKPSHMSERVKLEVVSLDYTDLKRVLDASTYSANPELLTKYVRINPLVAFFREHDSFFTLTEEQELAAVESAIELGWEYLRDIAKIMKRRCDRAYICAHYYCKCVPVLCRLKSSKECIERVVSAFPEFITASSPFEFSDEQYIRALTAKPELIRRHDICNRSLSKAVWRHALELDPAFIELLPKPDEDLQLDIVYRDPTNIKYIQQPCVAAMTFAMMSDSTCTDLIKHDGGFKKKFQESVIPLNKKRALMAMDEEEAKRIKVESPDDAAQKASI